MTRLIDHCRHGFRDRTNCRKCTPYLEGTTDMTKKKPADKLPTNHDRQQSGDWGTPRDGYKRAGNLEHGDIIVWAGRPARVLNMAWPNEDFDTCDLCLKIYGKAKSQWERDINPFIEFRIERPAEPVPAPAAPDQSQGIYLLRTTPTVPHAYQRSIVIVANSSVSAREHLVDLYKSAIYEDSTSYEAVLIGKAVTSKDQDPPRGPRIINDSGPAVGPDVQKAELLAELRAQSEWMVNEIRKYAGFRPNSGMNAFQQAVSVIDDLSDQVTKLNTLAHTRRMQRDAARRNADKGTDQ